MLLCCVVILGFNLPMKGKITKVKQTALASMYYDRVTINTEKNTYKLSIVF